MSGPRFFKSVLVAVLMVFVGLSGAVGASVSSFRPEERIDETQRLWFVEMESESLAAVDLSALRETRQSYLDHLADEKAEFRAAARQAGVRFAERFSFGVLWNGLSIDIDPAKLPALSRVPGVKALYPVMTFDMPQIQSVDVDPPVSVPETEPSSEDPDLLTAFAMTGADVAQSELGFTGAGIRVAIMDTGVDYDHPDLGGCFGPGCRVVAGFDFVGDAFNADPTSPSYNPTPVPDPDPDDCNGHGTHVAGIVGARGGVTGVAPGVRFGAYRVFGCGGSTTADIMMAAMEAALEDDMDVLNMSIGSAFQWPQYPTARASDELVEEGMVVVASIGNSGASGVYSGGAPGVGEKVIGVASYDNTHVNVISFTTAPGGNRVGYIPMAGSPNPPAPPTSGTSPEVVFVGRGCQAPLDTYFANPSGKVALIVRGTCTFNEKYQRAVAAGAAGVIIQNNAPGVFSGTIAPGTGSKFVIGISQADGNLIQSLSKPVTLTWTSDIASVPNPTGGVISSFSSYGLAPDLSFKPDIGAPGGLIRSTFPLESGGYAVISGTSMSSPHVAGAAALLLQSMDDDDDDEDERREGRDDDGDREDDEGRDRDDDDDDDDRGEGRDRDHDRDEARAAAVRDILQNSADPRVKGSGPFPAALDNVHRQGAGMLDIDDAILATVRVTPGKLALGESQAGAATRTLRIENRGSSDVTFDLSNQPALSTVGSTFAPTFVTESATVSFSQKGVTVTSVRVDGRDHDDDDDESAAKLKVTITANPALADKALYGGYLVLTPRDGGPVLRVPYAGFKGDYQSIVAMTPTGNAFPWITKRVAFNNVLADFVKQGNGATFTCTSGDAPWFLVHLDHQVQRLRAEVFEKISGKTRGQGFQIDFVGRNGAPTTFFALDWDCTMTKNGKARALADGNYIIVLSALKALGDPNNPAHMETWTSPDFNIDRP